MHTEHHELIAALRAGAIIDAQDKLLQVANIELEKQAQFMRDMQQKLEELNTP